MYATVLLLVYSNLICTQSKVSQSNNRMKCFLLNNEWLKLLFFFVVLISIKSTIIFSEW